MGCQCTQGAVVDLLAGNCSNSVMLGLISELSVGGRTEILALQSLCALASCSSLVILALGSMLMVFPHSVNVTKQRECKVTYLSLTCEL